MEGAPDLPTPHYVNKRQIWMRRKKELSLSSLHLQESTTLPDQKDRISILPEEVLHHILSLMPIEMAIRTSVLSKAWRHRWKRTRVVDFPNLRFSDDEEVNYTPINRTLELIESPNIESFTVVGHVGDRSQPDLEKWVDFALSRNVHTLRIGLQSIPHLKLPESLFIKNDQTQKLEVLFLSCVDYTPPPGVIFSASGFASLKTLAFTDCTLADSTVEMFLRECLFLEVLVLDMCFELVKVNISGSNLKLKQLTFKWYECFRDVEEDPRLLEVDAPGLVTLIYSGELTKILLKNCQGLEKIILLGKKESISGPYYDHIRGLSNQITQVKTLGVNCHFFEFVEKEYYERDIPFLEFQNLEHLFYCDSLWSSYEVYHLVGFLGDCPSLEDCVIDFRQKCWAAFCDTLWDAVRRQPAEKDVPQNQLYHGRRLEKLKSIRVICFSGFYYEMMLVGLLLEKAVNLQKLELFWRNDVSTMTDNVLQIVFTFDDALELLNTVQENSSCIEEKVNTLAKASRNARIVYWTKWEFCEWYKIFGV